VLTLHLRSINPEGSNDFCTKGLWPFSAGLYILLNLYSFHMTEIYTDDPTTWPSIKDDDTDVVISPPPTTKELQDQAIRAARKKEWMVCTEGNDYSACVIAWSKAPGTENGLATNWCRVMTIIDGIAQTETVKMTHYYQDANATVMGSGYVSKRLKLFKLNVNF
jgi:hypothetical protein